jgi:hypothetical protein
MADGRANNGGYRRPSNPSAVSGPGALSQRTDGGPGAKAAAVKLPNAGYGEQKDFQAIQSGAPIQKGGVPVPKGTVGEASAPLPPPLDAPTARPGEPVTSGASAGAGVGTDALGLFDPTQLAAADLQYVMRYLPELQYMVDMNPDSPRSTVAFIRYLRSQV